MTHLYSEAKLFGHYILDLASRSNQRCLAVIDREGGIKYFSSREYHEQIKKVATSLHSRGIKRGDKIAIFSNTRHEWSVCDLAAMSIGAVVVPLYPNLTTDDLSYIVNHSESKIIFVENRTSLRQLMVVRDKCPQLELVVVFDPPTQIEEGLWLSFSEFITDRSGRPQQPFSFEKTCIASRPTDPVTIIYTSGTTGQPKGVVLSHGQVIEETIEAFAALQITNEDRTLSFLPYSHVLGRTEHWGHLVIGYSMAYSAGNERLQEELQLIKPTVIVGVPRIFEKIYTQLKAKIETSTIDRRIFEWAYEIGKEVSEHQQSHLDLDLKVQAEYSLANSMIFERLRQQLFGGQLRFAISGGAPLSKEILEFFHACGVLILEGYGLTETTGAICVNRTYDFEFGSVGKPLNKSTIKIAKDGEILVRGPTIMSEYYHDKNSTSKVLSDGWLHTGDIGEISRAGNLIIKDRKKDLIKTANGKYVAPQKLEQLFKQLPFVSHAHIHGDQRKYIVAVLTLNKNYLFSDAREKGISFKSLEDLKDNPAIKNMIRAGVAQVNSSLAPHEAIKDYAVLSEDFSIESGEVTPSLKVKRKVVDHRYKSLIDSLYE
ncbi:MAG: Long-chain acyl-CoA synthetase [Pseudomonadota bacterium]|jgi:long-chain acyl-CoA synthetase